MRKVLKTRLAAGVIACFLLVTTMPFALAAEDEQSASAKAASETLDRDSIVQQSTVCAGVAAMIMLILG